MNGMTNKVRSGGREGDMGLSSKIKLRFEEFCARSKDQDRGKRNERDGEKNDAEGKLRRERERGEKV